MKNELDKYLEYAERINLINHGDVREKLFQLLLADIDYQDYLIAKEMKGIELNLPIKHLSALNFSANKVQEVEQKKLNQILILIREDKKWIKASIEQGMRTICFSSIDGYSNHIAGAELEIFPNSEYCQETVFNQDQKTNLCRLYLECLDTKFQPIFFSFLEDSREVLYMAQVDKKWFNL